MHSKNNSIVLNYPNKLDHQKILENGKRSNIEISAIPHPGIIIEGDNIEAMKGLLDSGFANSVDLVYIDPPYSTNQVFRKSATRSNAISQPQNGAIAYSDKLAGSEFLEFLRQRIILIRELMSPEGSMYLHIDYKIGHYVKVLLDEIFGSNCFVNDITRIKCNPKNFKRKGYGNIKDLILFYSKTKNYIWNNPTDPVSECDLKRLFKKEDPQFGFYTTIPLHAPGETKRGATGQKWNGMLPPEGRHWRCSPAELDELDLKGEIEWSKTGNPRRKIFAADKEDKKKQDIWNYKDPFSPVYPTEKNSEMLRDIILASSSSNSIVFDAFCGSGSTLKAAHDTGRKFIGIDKSPEAIKVAESRFYIDSTSTQTTLLDSAKPLLIKCNF